MKYDIVIVGGGTAGCACAYEARKRGLKVLIIEKQSFLGGTMTSSLVTPAMNTSKNNINTNFYNELMKSLNKIGGQVTYKDGNIGWFNPELMKIVLDELLDNVGVETIFDATVSKIIVNENKSFSLYLSTYINTIYANKKTCSKDVLFEYIETRYLVDGTGNGEIFQKLNCEFLENKNNFQPPNLRFMMSGIDLEKFSEWILKMDKDRTVTTSYNINGQIHLSTACTWDKKWALTPLFNKGIKNGELKEADVNYFQVFTVPGMPSTLAFNCPRLIFKDGFNPNNINDISKALKLGRQSILRLSLFFKSHFIGFKNAYISSIANSLGVRVSNRIKGKYLYTISDLKSGKIFENPCLISNYPVDIHSNKKGDSALEKQDLEYSLPIESLISEKYDNLFAIGRCISADFEAQAALRIIPSCFSMGEGLAKYIAQLDN